MEEPSRRNCSGTDILHQRVKIPKTSSNSIEENLSQTNFEAEKGFVVLFRDSDDVVRLACLDSTKQKVECFAESSFKGMPLGMGFAKFGSKMYLFGGFYLDPDSDQMYQYSRSTYVYDFTKKGDVWNICCCSEGPKPYPHMVEANGKVYALAGTRERGKGVESIQPAFEMFDPSTEHWNKLPDPPFLKFLSDWPRISIYFAFNDTLYVGCYPYDYEGQLFTFNFNSLQWSLCDDSSDWPTVVQDLLDGTLAIGDDIYQGKLYRLDTNLSPAKVYVYDLENPELVPSELVSQEALDRRQGSFTPHIVEGLDEVLSELHRHDGLDPHGGVFAVDERSDRFCLLCFLVNADKGPELIITCDFEIEKVYQGSPSSYILRAQNVNSSILSCDASLGYPITHCRF